MTTTVHETKEYWCARLKSSQTKVSKLNTRIGETKYSRVHCARVVSRESQRTVDDALVLLLNCLDRKLSAAIDEMVYIEDKISQATGDLE